MSIHEIEDVVEASVRCVDASSLSLRSKRELIFNLYQFQNQFDTGFTNMRTAYILLKNQYMFAFPINIHPAYQIQKTALDSLEAEGKFKFVEGGGYCCCLPDTYPQVYRLCCHVGTELWQQLAERGFIVGLAAESPRSLRPLQLIYRVLERAQETNCLASMYLWFTLLPMFFYDLKNGERQLVHKIGKMLCCREVYLALLEADSLTEMLSRFALLSPLVQAWLRPYQRWLDKVACEPNYLANKVADLIDREAYEEALFYTQKGLVQSPEDPYLQMYGAIIQISRQAFRKNPTLPRDRKNLTAGLDTLLGLEQTAPVVLKTVLYYKAVAYWALGQKSEAVQALEALLQLQPDHRSAQDFLNRLQK